MNNYKILKTYENKENINRRFPRTNITQAELKEILEKNKSKRIPMNKNSKNKSEIVTNQDYEKKINENQNNAYLYENDLKPISKISIDHSLIKKYVKKGRFYYNSKISNKDDDTSFEIFPESINEKSDLSPIKPIQKVININNLAEEIKENNIIESEVHNIQNSNEQKIEKSETNGNENNKRKNENNDETEKDEPNENNGKDNRDKEKPKEKLQLHKFYREGSYPSKKYSSHYSSETSTNSNYLSINSIFDQNKLEDKDAFCFDGLDRMFEKKERERELEKDKELKILKEKPLKKSYPYLYHEDNHYYKRHSSHSSGTSNPNYLSVNVIKDNDLFTLNEVDSVLEGKEKDKNNKIEKQREKERESKLKGHRHKVYREESYPINRNSNYITTTATTSSTTTTPITTMITTTGSTATIINATTTTTTATTITTTIATTTSKLINNKPFNYKPINFNPIVTSNFNSNSDQDRYRPMKITDANINPMIIDNNNNDNNNNKNYNDYSISNINTMSGNITNLNLTYEPSSYESSECQSINQSNRNLTIPSNSFSQHDQFKIHPLRKNTEPRTSFYSSMNTISFDDKSTPYLKMRRGDSEQVYRSINRPKTLNKYKTFTETSSPEKLSLSYIGRSKSCDSSLNIYNLNNDIYRNIIELDEIIGIDDEEEEKKNKHRGTHIKNNLHRIKSRTSFRMGFKDNYLSNDILIDVNKQGLPFHVVYAVWQIQQKFKASRKNKDEWKEKNKIKLKK